MHTIDAINVAPRPYNPFLYSQCGVVLNSYSYLDYTYCIWFCLFWVPVHGTHKNGIIIVGEKGEEICNFKKKKNLILVMAHVFEDIDL